MPVRRTIRRTRRVRRTGMRAAAVGAAQIAYRHGRNIGRKAYNAVQSLRNSGSAARYATNFVRQLAKGYPGKAAMGIPAGDYSQFTSKTIHTGRKEKLSLRTLDKHLRKNAEQTIFRWNGVKVFDDQGYYLMSRDISNVGDTMMPLYCYDLTAVANNVAGAQLNGYPFCRAQVTKATGIVNWVLVSNLGSDGVTPTNAISIEKTANVAPLSLPLEKSVLKWTDVRLNLWGSKNKAVKFTIQLVKLLDEDLDPYEKMAGRVNDTKHSSFWQSSLKTSTFNPIATTTADNKLRSKLKIIKTFTKIIQPTSSTENDVDPHAFTLKWFMRWNRDLSYREGNAMIQTYNDLSNQADFAFENMAHSTQVNPKQRILLLVRATAYTETNNDTGNTVNGSFDLSVRLAHELNN